MREYKKKFDKFYLHKTPILKTDNEWEEVSGQSFILEGWEEFDLFIRHTLDGWSITEGSTGMAVAQLGDSYKQIVSKVKNRLELCGKKTFQEKIDEAISLSGLSPRYELINPQQRADKE